MPALQPQPQITTLEQYEALPENVRAEVFDGQIYYMASPSQIHQTILTELLVSIRNYLRKKGGDCQVFPAPFVVKLSDSPLNFVQPDLMVVCDKDKLDGKRCNGAPDFIIEIVSPGNPSDDYIRKLYHYQNAGVREYWIVDPRTEKVIVYHLEQPDFQMASYTFQDKIQANIWEDFWIDFQELGL